MGVGSEQDAVGAKAPWEKVWSIDQRGHSKDKAAEMIKRREGEHLVPSVMGLHGTALKRRLGEGVSPDSMEKSRCLKQ